MTQEYEYLNEVSKLVQSDILVKENDLRDCEWMRYAPDSDKLWLNPLRSRTKTTQALWDAIVDEVGTLDGWLIHIVETWASDLSPDHVSDEYSYPDTFCDVYYSHMRYWLTNDRESVRWDAVDEAIDEYGFGLWEAIPAAQGQMAEQVISICVQWLSEYSEELQLLTECTETE